jgi:hypothetical protein
MAMPMPINVIAFTAKTEMSVNEVITLSTARDPATVDNPTMTGMKEATTLPKMSSDSRTTSGADTNSARFRSCSVIWLTSAYTG